MSDLEVIILLFSKCVSSDNNEIGILSSCLNRFLADGYSTGYLLFSMRYAVKSGRLYHARGFQNFVYGKDTHEAYQKSLNESISHRFLDSKCTVKNPASLGKEFIPESRKNIGFDKIINMGGEK